MFYSNIFHVNSIYLNKMSSLFEYLLYFIDLMLEESVIVTAVKRRWIYTGLVSIHQPVVNLDVNISPFLRGCLQI